MKGGRKEVRNERQYEITMNMLLFSTNLDSVNFSPFTYQSMSIFLC